MENENKLIPSNDWMKPVEEKVEAPKQSLYHFYLVATVNGKSKQLAMTPVQLALFDLLIKSLRNHAGGFDLLVVKDLPDNIFE